jgi:hypothetical protein
MSSMMLRLAIISYVVVSGSGLGLKAMQPQGCEGKRIGGLGTCIDPYPVLEMMRTSNDTQQLTDGCEQLGDFCHPSPEEQANHIGNTDQSELLNHGADELIVDIMRRHPLDAGLQLECLSTMASMANLEGCPGRCGEAHRKLVLTDGVFDLAASAIKRFPDELQHTPAELASGFLFVDPSQPRGIDNPGPDSDIMARLADTGLSSYIVAQMVAHVNDTGIIGSGIVYASRACHHPRISRQMVNAGFLEASPYWMRAFRAGCEGCPYWMRNQNFEGEVMFSNYLCFSENEEHLARLAAAGVIPETVNMIKSINDGRSGGEDESNDRAFRSGLGLLSRLSEGNETRRNAVFEAGAREAVAQGLSRLNLGSEQAQRRQTPQAEVSHWLEVLQIAY